MNKGELKEILENSENSGIEFKRDDILPQQLAKEIFTLANFQGGKILFGGKMMVLFQVFCEKILKNG